MASHYWAEFVGRGGVSMRFDTRIYLAPCARPGRSDLPVGCIVGKNPGSATPAAGGEGLRPIRLAGDRFLPNLLAILRKACELRGERPPAGRYLQVLNLFYLCDRSLPTAKKALRRLQRPPVCASEELAFPWAWFAWGGPDPLLDPLKSRFDNLRARRQFFYAPQPGMVLRRRPACDELAKHPQGMPHAGVVQHLAMLLEEPARRAV